MEQIHTYFNAEKSESTIFIATGVTAILLSVYFLWKVQLPFYNGMAYSLCIIAAIQLVVGGTVFLRSDSDIARVNSYIQKDVTKIQTEEIPRMHTVMKSFVTYRYIEIALIILGLGLFYFYSKGTLMRGFGLGLSIQSLFMLILDFFAESRGKTYLAFLETLFAGR
ncbi:MAG: hypothetical protein ACRCVT_01590 [Leadbetterella sp.]